MADYFFSLPGDLTARFKTDCAITEQEQLQLGAYVPGIVPIKVPPDNPDIIIEHVCSDVPRLEDGGAYIKLYAPHSKKLPVDLYHLFYGVERRELLKRDLYSIHAACVGKDNDYALIVGHSGAGKTTLAQKLVKECGMKLFSGNKTVVRFKEDGGVEAVAGTRTMTTLDKRLTRHAYEMSAGEYSKEKTVPIKSIAIVRVNDGVREAQRLEPLSALHTLYPYFMDTVNADIIVNGKDILNGVSSVDTKEKLALSLGKAIDSLQVFRYSGSIDFLSQKVFQL